MPHHARRVARERRCGERGRAASLPPTGSSRARGQFRRRTGPATRAAAAHDVVARVVSKRVGGKHRRGACSANTRPSRKMRCSQCDFEAVDPSLFSLHGYSHSYGEDRDNSLNKVINKLAVFTSGGDSPGMNACIRAVARTAFWYNKEIIGILHGYDGMIKNEFISLDPNAVSNIIQRGGTVLKTARSKEFMTDEGMQTAYDNLKKQHVDGIIAIGGDGTFRGAVAFNKKYDIPFIGVPGTIDNDLFGTDYTIGFDTAINTTLEAIDKIKDTAAAHDRLFFIEVMGRDTGYIALWTGIAGGAEEILLPETKTDIDELIKLLLERKSKNKSTIVIVAEGDEAGGAMKIAEAVKEKIPDYDTRVSILGHIQRGGSPTCLDRILAIKLGVSSVEALLNGETNKMAGIVNNKIIFTSLENAVKQHAPLDTDLLRYVKMLQ